MNTQLPSGAKKLLLATLISTLFTPLVQAEESKEELESITVYGTKSSALKLDSNGGALGSMAIIDTPFSIATITEDELAARQVNSLEDLFAHEASVNVRADSYSSWGETMSVRGLDLNYENNYKLNGQSLNAFNSELPYEVFSQIALLKGATGFMYGFAAPGGIVNYTTKKPTSDLLSVSLGYASDSIYSMHIDAGNRFGDQDQFGARVNLVHKEGDTQIDGGSMERDTVSVALDAQLTDSLYWTFDFISDSRNSENMSSLLYYSEWRMDEAVTSIPDTVDGSTNLALDDSFDDSDFVVFQSTLAYQFNDEWKAQIEYSRTENSTWWMKSIPYVANNDFDYKIMVYEQALDINFNQVNGFVEGSFDTGNINHEIVFGASYQKEEIYRNDPNRITVVLDEYNNLFNDVDIDYTKSLVKDLNKLWAYDQTSYFISDAIALSEQWRLLAGLRHSKYNYGDLNTDVYAWFEGTERDSKATTPTIALIYNPVDDTTVYASYVESLEEGQTVGDTYENVGEVLDATISKQYEVGAKLERENYNLTTALFRIERVANITTDDNYLTQDGITLYQGFEINALANINSNTGVYANLLLLDASYDNMDAGSTIEGNQVAGSPEHQFSVGANYTCNSIPGLTSDIAVRYYDKTFIDTANALELDSYVLVDVNASYETTLSGKNVVFRAAIKNLTDKEYWASTGSASAGIRIGAPRTLSLNMNVDF